jgi:hypothetical protein
MGDAMSQALSISIDDPTLDCPVNSETVGRLAKADPRALPDMVDGIPEATRARLAVWLYGRSHTHEVGVRIAATCDGSSLRRAGGLIGNALYDLSRRPYTPPTHGTRTNGGSRISLGGSRRFA